MCLGTAGRQADTIWWYLVYPQKNCIELLLLLARAQWNREQTRRMPWHSRVGWINLIQRCRNLGTWHAATQCGFCGSASSFFGCGLFQVLSCKKALVCMFQVVLATGIMPKLGEHWQKLKFTQDGIDHYFVLSIPFLQEGKPCETMPQIKGQMQPSNIVESTSPSQTKCGSDL